MEVTKDLSLAQLKREIELEKEKINTLEYSIQTCSQLERDVEGEGEASGIISPLYQAGLGDPQTDQPELADQEDTSEWQKR